MFVYIDETLGGADKDLTAVAGYLFEPAGAAQFLSSYRSRVEPLLPKDKRGRKIFHAAPCFDAGGQFVGMQRAIRECILGRMAEVIRETIAVGVVIGIEKAEFDEGVQGQYYRVRTKRSPDNRVQFTERRPYTQARLVGSQYSLCLLRCIHGINQWLDEQQITGEIDYVIEAGCAHQDEANAILNRLLLSKLAPTYRFGKFSFVQKGPDCPHLFAPDYFVWAWQHNDRVSEGTIRDEYGDWEKALVPLIESKPHLAAYLTAQSVNTQALVNFANGLMRPDEEL